MIMVTCLSISNSICKCEIVKPHMLSSYVSVDSVHSDIAIIDNSISQMITLTERAVVPLTGAAVPEELR